MNSPEQTVIAALREACRALSIGDDVVVGNGKALEQSAPVIAHEVAAMLEATATLLHHVHLDPVPRSDAAHSLHAVVQQIGAAAQLARRVANTDGFEQTPTSTLPESQFDVELP